jgi:hypothetical protein
VFVLSLLLLPLQVRLHIGLDHENIISLYGTCCAAVPAVSAAAGAAAHTP